MIDITDKEIEILAKKNNLDFNTMKKEIELRLKELRETNKGIEKTIKEHGYIRFPNNLSIYGYGKNDELNRKYICYTPNIENILKKDKKDIAIVSGFGATNSPTAGTLSMIEKLIEFQKSTGLYTYLIINDLGSINARNIDINKVLDLTESFKQFVVSMGFDLNNGEIRTHNDIDHARTFSLVSRYINLSDFEVNGEVTDDTYNKMNLKGTDFSVMIDHAYTATDVLLPIIKDGKSGIIVPAGLEEYYHANIGGVVLSRMIKDPSINYMLPKNIDVGAIYSKLISGFYPYFKQSKSIPSSSVNLGDTNSEIYDKIINGDKRNDKVILEMILLASNYENEKIQSIISLYKNRESNYQAWNDCKKEYYDYFISIKEKWDNSKVKKLTLKEKIYR